MTQIVFVKIDWVGNHIILIVKLKDLSQFKFCIIGKHVYIDILKKGQKKPKNDN